MDQLQLGNIQKEYSKEIFNTNINKEDNLQKNPGPSFMDKPQIEITTGKTLEENLNTLAKKNSLEGEFADEQMKESFNRYMALLPESIKQTMSRETLAASWKLRNEQYLKKEEVKEYASARDEWSKKATGEVINLKGTDTLSRHDSYKNKTFSECVKILLDHITISPSSYFTDFKSTVAELDRYVSENASIDYDEYCEKYNAAWDAIEEYINSHENPISWHGRKRLKLAKSLKEKMSTFMSPTKLLDQLSTKITLSQGEIATTEDGKPDYESIANQTEKDNHIGKTMSEANRFPAGEQLFFNKHTGVIAPDAMLNHAILNMLPLKDINFYSTTKTLYNRMKIVNPNMSETELKNSIVLSMFNNMRTQVQSSVNNLEGINAPSKQERDEYENKLQTLNDEKFELRSQIKNDEINERKLAHRRAVYRANSQGWESFKSVESDIKKLEESLEGLNKTKASIEDGTYSGDDNTAEANLLELKNKLARMRENGGKDPEVEEKMKELVSACDKEISESKIINDIIHYVDEERYNKKVQSERNNTLTKIDQDIDSEERKFIEENTHKFKAMYEYNLNFAKLNLYKAIRPHVGRFFDDKEKIRMAYEEFSVPGKISLDSIKAAIRNFVDNHNEKADEYNQKMIERDRERFNQSPDWYGAAYKSMVRMPMPTFKEEIPSLKNIMNDFRLFEKEALEIEKKFKDQKTYPLQELELSDSYKELLDRYNSDEFTFTRYNMNFSTEILGENKLSQLKERQLEKSIAAEDKLKAYEKEQSTIPQTTEELETLIKSKRLENVDKKIESLNNNLNIKKETLEMIHEGDLKLTAEEEAQKKLSKEHQDALEKINRDIDAHINANVHISGFEKFMDNREGYKRYAQGLDILAKGISEYLKTHGEKEEPLDDPMEFRAFLSDFTAGHPEISAADVSSLIYVFKETYNVFGSYSNGE